MTGTGNAMKQMGFTWAKFVYQHILRGVMLNLRWTPIPTRPQLTLTALNVPESVQIIRLMDTAVGPTFYFWYYSSSSVCLVKPLKQCQLSYYCLVMMDIPLCAIEALYIKIWSGEKFVQIYCTKLDKKWEIFSHRCTLNRSLWLKMPTMWILHPLCQQWHQTVSFCVNSALEPECDLIEGSFYSNASLHWWWIWFSPKLKNVLIAGVILISSKTFVCIFIEVNIITLSSQHALVLTATH